jgi:hypothetical protein
MEYLLMPPQKKRPAYRKDREHGAFLTKLEDHMTSVHDVERRVAASLRDTFDVDETATEGSTAEVTLFLPVSSPTQYKCSVPSTLYPPLPPSLSPSLLPNGLLFFFLFFFL